MAAEAGTITTLAGNGRLGYSGDGGPAVRAALNRPYNLCTAPDGILYFADHFNHCIRRITPDGTITTVAGGGPSSELRSPLATALKSDGTLLVTDAGRDQVLEVLGDGTLRAVIGCGEMGTGGEGGPATQVRLNTPAGLAVSTHGVVYVSDRDNHRILSVDASGTVARFAGTGEPGSAGDGGHRLAAQLHAPTGLSVSTAGTLYIADAANWRVRAITLDGTIATIAGTGERGYGGDGGRAIEAALALRDVAVATDGSLVVADYLNHRVRRIGPDGRIDTIAGTGTAGYSGDGGPAQRARLNLPGGVAVDRDGSVYIGDSGNARIRKVWFALPVA